MITTTAAGRTWHYSHSTGRQTAEHNASQWGRTGGLMHAVGLAVAPDDHIFILSRGRHHGAGEEDAPDVSKRIGKTTIDEDHIGDFARTELTWPAGLAIASDGNVYCSDEYTNRISYCAPRHAAWDTRLNRENFGGDFWANRPTLKRKPKRKTACR